MTAGIDIVKERMKTVHRAMKTADGIAMMKLLEDNFDGDTFDLDPHRHAFNAGQRSVIIWINTYLRAKENAQNEQNTV